MGIFVDFVQKHHLRDFNDKGFFVLDQKISTEWLNRLVDELEKHQDMKGVAFSILRDNRIVTDENGFTL